MANTEHVKVVKAGKDAISEYLKYHPEVVNNEEVTFDLSGADLHETDLREASLQRADLTKANLEGAVLLGADLTGAILESANMNSSNLSGTDFALAEMDYANFEDAYFLETNFSNAKLRHACLRKARLDEVNFYNADLSYADLSGANLTKTILLKTKLHGAILNGICLDNTFTELWDITDVECFVFWTFDSVQLEIDDTAGRVQREEVDHPLLPYTIINTAPYYKRIPKEGFLAPGEFEDRFKSRPTIEFLFENGMNAFDPAILGAVIDEANSKHTEAGLRLLSIDARGGIPRAIIEISEKVTKGDAIQLVHTYYQQKLEQLNRDLEGLKGDKESLLQTLSGKILLSPIETHRLIDTEQNIVEALNKNTLTGEELAKKAGYPYNSNFKSTLSSLRKRGILGNKSPGYFLEDKYHYLLNKSD